MPSPLYCPGKEEFLTSEDPNSKLPGVCCSNNNDALAAFHGSYRKSHPKYNVIDKLDDKYEVI